MKLIARKSEWLTDWYVIERAEHNGAVGLQPMDGGFALVCASRFSDADVEGDASEMLGIADGIETRKGFRAKRCAVRIEGDRAYFCSPRNSSVDGECLLAEADDLAVQIRAALTAPVRGVTTGEREGEP